MTPNPGFHDPSAKSKSLATATGTIHKTISSGILLSLAFLVPMSEDPKLSRLILRGLPILMVPFFLIWSPGSVRQYFSSHATDRDIRCWGTIGLVLLALPCWILLPGLSPN